MASRKRKKETIPVYRNEGHKHNKRKCRKDATEKVDYFSNNNWQERDPEGFEICLMEGKGRGVITTVKREKGDFLMKYAGERISAEEGEKREKQESTGFRFFFDRYCIDASEETGRLGRLVNHSKRKKNAKMIKKDGFLYLYALRDIDIGEEILYDYGINLLFEAQEKVQISRTDKPTAPEGPLEISDTTQDSASLSAKPVKKLNKPTAPEGPLEISDTTQDSASLSAKPVKKRNKPTAPEGPLEISNTTQDSASLSWKPPKSDGGSPLIMYIIESRERKTDNWLKIAEVAPAWKFMTYNATKLDPNIEYFFQVSAVNTEGIGPPLTSKRPAKPVKKLSIPTVDVPQPQYSASTDSTVTLQCSYSANPTATQVCWQKNGVDIGDTSNTNKYGGSTLLSPSLIIYNAQESDVGSYMCCVTNSVGTGTSTTIQLTVVGSIPTVDVPQPQYSASTDSTVTLQCSYSANPTATQVCWQKNGVDIGDTSTTNKYGGSTLLSPSLIIYNAQESDVGSYMCCVTNSVGTGTSTTIQLTVVGSIPTVDVPQPQYSASTDSTVTLQCSYSANPTATQVCWQKNGVDIGDTSNTNKYGGSTLLSPSLIIYNAQESDVGSYMCCVTNSVGTGTSTTIQLTVVGSIPTVDVPQPQYSASTDSTVTLQCSYSANPTATQVCWQKNGVDIGDTSTTNKYGGSTLLSPSLIIYNAQESDVGSYMCCVTNSVGTGTSTTIQLTVVGKLTLNEEEDEERDLDDDFNDPDYDYEEDDDDDDDDDDDIEEEELEATEEDSEKNRVETSIEDDNVTYKEFPALEMGKKITFQTATYKSGKGNLMNKKHSCIYCDRLYPNIARHMERKHSNEIEVAKIMILPKKSAERRTEWGKLVNAGDYQHNYDVYNSGKGEVIPKYRSSNEQSLDLITCYYCRGMYRRRELWRHFKTCQKKSNSEEQSSTSKLKPVASGKKLMPNNCNSEEFQSNIINFMREDNVKGAVLSDPTIIKHGMAMYADHGNQTHKHVYISNKMRELGRLLIELRKHGVNTIYDSIDKNNWDTLIESVNSLCQFEPISDRYGIPSLACKIGQALKKLAGVIAFEKLKTGDKVGEEMAETFIKLYERGWTTAVSAKAVRTMEANKYNRPKLLPMVNDVVKINKHIVRRCAELEHTSGCYRDFCNLVLAQIILFNRKRGGEAERMTVKNFEDAQTGGIVDSVVLSTLTEFEKNLCKTHLRVEIVGKKNRKVPVLLTKSMKRNITALLRMRKEEEISSNFLFARPGEASRHPFRGVDALRSIVKEADVERPELITSTLLRKQMATLAQVLNLSETSQDILATFQGHDIRVHREFYRLPEETMQVAKVSKLLHCINSGSIAKYKGKDFEEITFDYDDELDEEEEEIENEEEEIENEEEEGEEELDEEEFNKPISKLTTIPPKPKRQKEKTIEKRSWSAAEKRILNSIFEREIRLGKVPGKNDIVNAQRKSSLLAPIPWTKIKFAVYNIIKKRKC